MTDQTPEARLAAALVQSGYAGTFRPGTIVARDILAADPTLICPDPDAHYAETRRLNRMFNPGVKVESDPDAHEGVTFTVDSLAAHLCARYCDPSLPWADCLVDEYRGDAAAIIQAAKEDERE